MNHYAQRGASLAEDLVNTHDVTLPEPEHLRGPADLDRFLSERGLLLPEGRSATPEDLRAVRGLRAPLRAVFEARDEAVAAGALNGLLEGAALAPTAETGSGSWRLGLRVSRDLPLPRRVAVEAALGLVGALERLGLDRLRACAADPCRDVFVDTSRNGSRRYCGPGCANRHNVAAFRGRRRAAGEDA